MHCWPRYLILLRRIQTAYLPVNFILILNIAFQYFKAPVVFNSILSMVFGNKIHSPIFTA
jgi:hypothetical protein